MKKKFKTYPLNKKMLLSRPIFHLHFLVIITAIIIVFFYSFNRSFPYAGLWEGERLRSDGKGKEIWFVEFNKNGACSVGAENSSGGEAFPCTYRMRGQSAVIVFRMPGIEINGQMANAFVTAKVTPRENGSILKLTTLSVVTDPDIGDVGSTGRDSLLLYKTKVSG